MKVAVIGGGAAGFFSALSAKKHFPHLEVCILEKSSKILSKVKISGGGRCNVTNATFDNKLLSKNYPPMPILFAASQFVLMPLQI